MNAVWAVSSPTVLTRPDVREQKKQPPEWKVIVLNDDFNTFQHVHDCLMRHIPEMTDGKAWELTEQVHQKGTATVWIGVLERAELYVELLRREGLTVAPPEPA